MCESDSCSVIESSEHPDTMLEIYSLDIVKFTILTLTPVYTPALGEEQGSRAYKQLIKCSDSC